MQVSGTAFHFTLQLHTANRNEGTGLLFVSKYHIKREFSKDYFFSIVRLKIKI